MIARPLTNIAASVRDRLLNRSRKSGEDFQFLLNRYVVRNGLGDRAGTCIDPKMQPVQGKAVCVVSCQRSPEPVFLRWKGMETASEGDFFVRSGPGTVKLSPESAKEYVRTRFPGGAQTS